MQEKKSNQFLESVINLRFKKLIADRRILRSKLQSCESSVGTDLDIYAAKNTAEPCFCILDMKYRNALRAKVPLQMVR